MFSWPCEEYVELSEPIDRRAVRANDSISSQGEGQCLWGGWRGEQETSQPHPGHINKTRAGHAVTQ